MGQTTALTRTLNLLASIRHEDDPTIGELLAAVPDLQKMNWINRFGPARAWEIVASDIETDALDWLTKALVIAEREFDWIGGSVAQRFGYTRHTLLGLARTPTHSPTGF
jgi:hypothetical protein